MLVASVAMQSEIRAVMSTVWLSKRVSTSTGFQSVSLKITVVAEVTATPMNEYSAIVAGNPSA